MSVRIIYFVHGTTTDNLEHIATGWNPGILSDKGIAQSIELKNRIDIDKIDLVITSDLKRAVDSASYTYNKEKKILCDMRIRECNYGVYNGKDASNVKYEEHISVPFENGEALVDVEKRLRDFCKYLLQNFDEKTIALVSHKAPQLALDVITKGISWEEAISKDWRKTKSWKPGWEYNIDKSMFE